MVGFEANKECDRRHMLPGHALIRGTTALKMNALSGLFPSPGTQWRLENAWLQLESLIIESSTIESSITLYAGRAGAGGEPLASRSETTFATEIGSQALSRPYGCCNKLCECSDDVAELKP